VIAGSPVVGQLLTCSTGSWSGTPTAYGFAWLRDGVIVPGATGASRQVTAADAGRALACQVRASNDGGTSTAVSIEAVVAGEVPTAAPGLGGPVTGVAAPAPVGLTPPRLRRAGLIGVSAPSGGRVGRLIRFTATFSATPAGRVALQRRVGRKFVNVASVRPRARRVAITFTPTKAGLLVFRLRYVSAGKQRLSRTILVKVRPAS
jgi:hypothetical protein